MRRAFSIVIPANAGIQARTPAGFVSVGDSVVVKRGAAGNAESFQWIETPYGDVTLLSLATNRYLRIDAATGRVTADHPGPEPGRSDGAQFRVSVNR